MKKVIVKTKLSSKDSFEGKLSDTDLDFSQIYWQHDRIYVPRNYAKNANYPRLIMRTEVRAVDQAPKYALILRRHIEDSGVDIVEETAIKDYETTINIILQLGFRPIAEIYRQRQDLKMDENNVIYLDKIEHLPNYYAKIESNLAPNDSVVEAKLDLERTFKALGEADFISSPYFEI